MLLYRAPVSPYPEPMSANVTPPPAPRLSAPEQNLERAIERVAFGESLLGEKLLVLGRGRPDLPHALGGMVATAADGDLVLVLGFSRVDASTAPAIADRLDRLTTVKESGLVAIMEKPLMEEQLDRRRREYFSASDETASSPPFNARQRVVLLVEEAPSLEAWKALVIELGELLSGVWQLGPDDPVPVSPPHELLRAQGGTGSIPWATVLAMVVVVAGAALGVLALSRDSVPSPPAASVTAPVVEPPIRDVAFDVPLDATHSQWIGQQRLLRSSDGRLVALYPTDGGLQIVTDQRNQGRSWRSPILVPDISATSLSAAIDRNDNIHLAFSDGSGISYARMDATARGWRSPVVTPLDDASASPVVDIDLDNRDRFAYVTWAAQSEGGETPRWSVVSSGEDAVVVQTGDLAEEGDEIPVLVNIATGPGSTIHVSYRRGDSQQGWFARAGETDPEGSVVWAPEERLSSQQGFGAASLAVDGEGVAHLVLRDSTSFALLYFRRTQQGGWSSAQTAVEADATVEIDLPMLSLDASSKLVYLFFQTAEFNPANEIAVAVRDPASGWEGPYRIAPTTEGALFPTAISVDNGQPITLWTKGGAAPSIQAARVIAP